MCGLQSKLELGILEDYIADFDILCVCETKYNASTSTIKCDEMIDGYRFIPMEHDNLTNGNTNGNTNKIAGIHGIGVFVKLQYAHQVKPISICSSDSIFWLDISIQNSDLNFLLGVVYLPHEGSRYYDQNMFDDVISDLIHINSVYNFPNISVGPQATI